jgi:hypothetical protein
MIHYYPMLPNKGHLEISPPLSGCETGLACHPERSEGSRSAASKILRFAQDDKSYLQMSVL